jgi:hypothetical protein
VTLMNVRTNSDFELAVTLVTLVTLISPGVLV